MCYHPLLVFSQFGEPERCALRPGNVHTADGWKDVLEPVIARYRVPRGLFAKVLSTIAALRPLPPARC
jgi:Transposase DDE domain group 1